MSATILTVVGRKGGCGKSTLVTSLAGSLVKAKRRVLIIDLDGQASATRSLFGREHVFDPRCTIATLFEQPRVAPSSVIHPTAIDNLSVVPATAHLDRFMIPQQGQNHGVLYPLLKSIIDDFDMILIDTPPNTNAWPTYAALSLSHWAITPVIPDSFGAHSCVDTIRVIQDVGKAEFIGFVLSMVMRNRVHTTYKAAIRKAYPGLVFKTEITQAVAYEDAAASRMPLALLTPRPAAAAVIDKVVNEIGTRTTRRVRKAA